MNYSKLLLLASVLLASCSASLKNRIDLSGTWQFTTDSAMWGSTILLPGSMASNGIGDDITLHTPWTGSIVDSSYFKDDRYAPYRKDGNIKVPFWLQPVKYYKGAAWYKKQVDIPKGWRHRDISLFLERCHWETRLWVDGQEVGMQNSLATPHRYDLSEILTPGRHWLTLRVDNSIKEIDPGENSHSISDHTQGNWNGIVGDIYLEVRPQVNIAHTGIYPDVAGKSIRVVNTLTNRKGKTTDAVLMLKSDGRSIRRELALKPGTTEVTTVLSLGDSIRLWDEFTPNLYRLEVRLSDLDGATADTCSETFGMRELNSNGRQLTINSRPLFLRGTLDCAAFPKTGYPPTDRKSWAKIFRTCKAYGLNHVRFHSWCPPEEAFAVADEMGIYLEVECSSWANHTVTLGDGHPIDRFVMDESEAMVRNYGNHPSFCMMMYGNEPAGGDYSGYLGRFVSHWKAVDGRRLYSTGGGWPNLPASDFLSDPLPRIQGWGTGLRSIINAQRPRTDYDWSDYAARFAQPIVSHEIGQWCAYPNFREIGKYDGVMRARNFEIFQASLKEHGMAALADSFLLASGKLQALCYKADIEAALRTEGFGGFQLLGLSDFPGQGTALVGVLDAFWEEKGYVSPEEYRRFCDSTVPLVRLPKLVYTSGEVLEAFAEVAHYGQAPLAAADAGWSLSDAGGKVYGAGKWEGVCVPLGSKQPLGSITAPLNQISVPQQLTLEVYVGGWKNRWNIWVYPPNPPQTAAEAAIPMVDRIDSATLKTLDEGGSVLLSLRKGTLPRDMGGEIQVGFSSIFWNTAWTLGQAPHTLGILCNPRHPALGEFPTDYHSDYQWWDAMSHAGAIEFAKLSPRIQPLVRVIDDWFANRPLALLFEVRVGRGRLLVSGIDFWQDMDQRPEARQLLHSLKKYMAGTAFRPSVEVDGKLLQKLNE